MSDTIQNGKGPEPRRYNPKKYEKNYLEIKWSDMQNKLEEINNQKNIESQMTIEEMKWKLRTQNTQIEQLISKINEQNIRINQLEADKALFFDCWKKLLEPKR